MNIQVDFWQLVGLLVAFLGACGAGGGLLLNQVQKHLDERFAMQEKMREERSANQDRAREDQHKQLTARLDGLEQVNRDETLQWQRVEREFLKHMAELPVKYVMRDDYIRGQSIIEAKLDGLAGKLENAQLRAVINHNQGASHL
ncbi:hypothetical protein [Acidovorax sp. BLS4]|uniref:hypothetical protein n=1 Tax=Acidovorax sp. BLS4 TaxID=3273430 RepID=UPI002942F9AC|nr:hypothetical protein [Paracidovorax avenae]WOI46985.1 hypothetical protein R1Z03_07170 [Paracidovorax avenae]